MNGIDISRWQSDLDISKIDCDFVIIKATQSTNFISPTFHNQMKQALSLGKLVGVYHYAGGGGAKAEADYFLEAIKNYIGKVILCLDWEGNQNPNFNNASYAIQWLKYVKQQTGITPFIYMSKSVCRDYNWSQIKDFPLWCAQYANNDIVSGYQNNPWTDNKGFGVWAKPLIFQYTGMGRLSGYKGNLDLDEAYISSDEWRAYAGAKSKAFEEFNVKVLCDLNVRSDAGIENPVVKCLNNIFTIHEVKKASDGGTWGRIDDGWINISSLFVRRVD